MKRFKNILVGVDVANEGHLVAETFSAATNAAIDNGHWLAKRNSARLVFFNALEVPEYARFIAEEHDDLASDLIADTEDRLAALTQRAKAEDIVADYAIAFGKTWVELIRQILKQQHDLVITGTRQRGTATSVLFGSTGIKLLRKCPCPVWITKPRERPHIASILVADDLTPVSDLALELGVATADLHQAQLHVLHVLELGLGRREWDSFKIRERARAEATRKLDEQLARIGVTHLPHPPHVDIVVDSADNAIIHQIEQCKADLLVMGTVSRGGIAGVFMGNTAERLLPHIPCSVLAVKPPGFVSPVNLAESA